MFDFKLIIILVLSKTLILTFLCLFAVFIFSKISLLRKFVYGFILIFIFFDLVLPFHYFYEGFSEAVNNYNNGIARLAVGYPSYKKTNKLNNPYRVKGYSGYGCSPSIDDNKSTGNNAGLDYMFKKYGYQKGTYKGYYPDEKETINLLEKNKSLINAKISPDDSFITFKINNKSEKIFLSKNYYLESLNLPDKTQNKINLSGYSSNYINFSNYPVKDRNIKLHIIPIKDCIILSEPDSNCVFLIDRKNGLEFTKYYISSLQDYSSKRK